MICTHAPRTRKYFLRKSNAQVQESADRLREEITKLSKEIAEEQAAHKKTQRELEELQGLATSRRSMVDALAKEKIELENGFLGMYRVGTACACE